MKLSMSLIAKYLYGYQPECHILEDALTIKGVRFLSDQHRQYSLEYIYVGAAGGYFQDTRYQDALLLASGQNQIICHGADYEELLNDVLSAFEYYNGFEQELNRMAMEHRPLKEMMEVVEQVMDNPFCVFDINGNLLSCAHWDVMVNQGLLGDMQNKRQSEPITLDSITLGTMTLGKVFVDMEGNVSHDLTDKPQHMRIKGTKELGTVGMYLYQDTEAVGFVLDFLLEKLEISMGLCLEPFIAQCCANALEFTGRNSPRQSNHWILLDLLKGDTPAPAVLKRFQGDLRIEGEGVLLIFQSLSIQNYTLRKMLMDEMQQQRIPCITCIYEEGLVILTDRRYQEAVLQQMNRKISPDNLVIGVSMPVQELESLPVNYAQAMFALNASTGPGVRYCKDLALSYLLQILREKKMSTYLMHPVVYRLKKYDSDNDTELFQTLEVYVKSGCSKTEATARLHIHLNTLKYRLNRIQELTEIDYKNSEEMFYIRLSMEIGENGS